MGGEISQIGITYCEFTADRTTASNASIFNIAEDGLEMVLLGDFR